MKTTDTPRTDAIEPQLHSNVGGWVRADFARELEREVEFWKSKASEAEDREGKHEAEVEELQQQKRNCMEIIDDDAKEKSELKAEVERLQSQLKRAVEIAEMFSQVKGLHYQCNCRSCQMLAALKGELKCTH